MNVRVDNVRSQVGIVAPHGVENLVSSENLPGVAHQEFQERKLPRRELDETSIPSRLVPHQVEHEIANLEPIGIRRIKPTAREGTKPREKLGKGEGLDHVIVRAGVEPADPI